MRMKTKCLVLNMTRHEVNMYVQDHPQWRIPLGEEAIEIEPTDIDWEEFRVNEYIGGRELVYNKLQQCFKITHPLFKHRVVLIEKEIATCDNCKYSFIEGSNLECNVEGRQIIDGPCDDYTRRER